MDVHPQHSNINTAAGFSSELNVSHLEMVLLHFVMYYGRASVALGINTYCTAYLHLFTFHPPRLKC